jgi:hypothetical protein
MSPVLSLRLFQDNQNRRFLYRAVFYCCPVRALFDAVRCSAYILSVGAHNITSKLLQLLRVTSTRKRAAFPHGQSYRVRKPSRRWDTF